MSKKRILLAITNGLWLIDAQSAETLGESVASVLAGRSFWDADHKSHAEFLISSPQSAFLSSKLDAAPQGSVAIIDICGPIMKEDNCGDPGTKTYEQLIQQAAANPNITGIVLQIDSPGGTVDGTQSLANVIKAVNKPVVTLAEDLMASAAYWIGSSADYVFANTGTTRVGSIGTMISFADMQAVWEKAGVKFHNIFADASSEKNKAFLEARQGNYDKIKTETLNPLNNQFLAAVKSNRAGKIDSHFDATLKGQVYTAPDAIKYGLIDAEGNLQDAIDKVYELANVSAPAQQSQQNLQQTNMKKVTLTAAHAAIIALCGVAMEAGKDSVEVELTDELVAKINSALEAGTKAATDLTTANEKATQAATELKAAQDEATAAKSDLETLKKSNPGATQGKKEGTDEVETSTKEDYKTEYDERLLKAKKDWGQ